LGFTLPSVIALILFALALQSFDVSSSGWIHGLKLVAVAIVAHAVYGMGQKLTPDRSRMTIAILTAAAVLLWQTSLVQILLIILAGIIGIWLYRKSAAAETEHFVLPISRTVGGICLALFFLLLIGLPLLRETTGADWIAFVD